MDRLNREEEAALKAMCQRLLDLQRAILIPPEMNLERREDVREQLAKYGGLNRYSEAERRALYAKHLAALEEQAVSEGDGMAGLLALIDSHGVEARALELAQDYTRGEADVTRGRQALARIELMREFLDTDPALIFEQLQSWDVTAHERVASENEAHERQMPTLRQQYTALVGDVVRAEEWNHAQGDACAKSMPRLAWKLNELSIAYAKMLEKHRDYCQQAVLNSGEDALAWSPMPLTGLRVVELGQDMQSRYTALGRCEIRTSYLSLMREGLASYKTMCALFMQAAYGKTDAESQAVYGECQTILDQATKLEKHLKAAPFTLESDVKRGRPRL